jgi:hypothetical protein
MSTRINNNLPMTHAANGIDSKSNTSFASLVNLGKYLVNWSQDFFPRSTSPNHLKIHLKYF